MTRVPGDFIDLLILAPNEEIPAELQAPDGPNLIVQQGTNLFNLQHYPMYTVMSAMKIRDGKNADDVLKEFGEYAYKTNLVYLLNDKLADYKISPDLIRYVAKYFREIYAKHKVEAAVVLMLNPETKDWQVLFVPQVNCSHGSVNYLIPKDDFSREEMRSKRLYEAFMEEDGNKEIMAKCLKSLHDLTDAGYMIYGTIHSHCNFSAFHSGVDDSDEVDFDGLHITIGNVDGEFSFACRFQIKTAGFKKDIKEVTGVTDITELTGNIDSIVVSDEHMALMQPDIGRQSYVTVVSSSSSPKSKYNNGYGKINWDEWDSDKNWDKDHRDLLTGLNGDHPISGDLDLLDNDELEEYNDNVILEDHAVRLFDLKTRDRMWVRYMYYYQNPELFPEERYVPLDDPPMPEVKDRKQKKKDKKKESGGTAGKIVLANHPDVNSEYPSGSPTGQGNTIYNLHEFVNIYGKAKKKGN